MGLGVGDLMIDYDTMSDVRWRTMAYKGTGWKKRTEF